MSFKCLMVRFPIHLILLSLTAAWLVPTLGLFVTSFRSPQDIFGSGWWTVFANLFDLDQFTFTNYMQVIAKEGLGRSFFNSLSISVPATLLSTFMAAMAAFGFAWMRFAGRKILFLLLIGLMVVPLQMTFIPILPIYRWLGLSGTFPGIWLAHAGYGLPLSTYLLYTSISRVPPDLLDSAAIDGASPMRIFCSIVIPISFPALASVFIFQFLWIWNDFLVALIYLGAAPKVAPVTLTVANLVTNRGQNWELLTAAAFVSMALPLLVFLSLQRHFVRGVIAGAMKG
ncbi:MAG: carbohydrate ABC transporter permease [Desulfobacterales bacterium]|nr:MAG: carbohydrate ABC transporter permease [Desulfobacterales bacterium]